MSDFYGKIKNTVDNVSATENGMTGYKTTNHALLDFNFKVSSFRSQTEAEILKEFKKIIAENEQYVLKYLFYLRDAREGIGERKLFRVCLKELLKANFENKDEIINQAIYYIAEYGRYDDLMIFMDTAYENVVVSAIKKQLKEDFANYKANKPISLLAKWLPSANASKTTRKLALKLIDALGTNERMYRRTLSALRGYSNVIETKMCAKEWDKIDYNAVPSKANIKYANAFLKNDEKRRRDYLSKLAAGDKSVHINSSVNFPHDIVAKYGLYGRNYREDMEQLWKALKPCEGLKDTIVVRDGSGSMKARIGNSNVSALEVSTALAIYCSQYTQSEFKDKFITFSKEAKIVDLSKAGSLRTKLNICVKEADCSNTDLENVFDLILKTAVDNQMKPEEIPSTVLVISDMEFDPSHESIGWYGNGHNFSSNIIDSVARKFKAHGYTLPKLAFWNVASRTGTIPCKTNENGVVLISGFSQNVLSMVMNGKTDPYEALVEELNKKRYEPVPLLKFTQNISTTKRTTKQVDVPDFLK